RSRTTGRTLPSPSEEAQRPSARRYLITEETRAARLEAGRTEFKRGPSLGSRPVRAVRDAEDEELRPTNVTGGCELQRAAENRRQARPLHVCKDFNTRRLAIRTGLLDRVRNDQGGHVAGRSERAERPVVREAVVCRDDCPLRRNEVQIRRERRGVAEGWLELIRRVRPVTPEHDRPLAL